MQKICAHLSVLMYVVVFCTLMHCVPRAFPKCVLHVDGIVFLSVLLSAKYCECSPGTGRGKYSTPMFYHSPSAEE